MGVWVILGSITRTAIVKLISSEGILLFDIMEESIYALFVDNQTKIHDE